MIPLPLSALYLIVFESFMVIYDPSRSVHSVFELSLNLDFGVLVYCETVSFSNPQH